MKKMNEIKLLEKWNKSWDKTIDEIWEELSELPIFNKFFTKYDLKEILNKYKGIRKGEDTINIQNKKED